MNAALTVVDPATGTLLAEAAQELETLCRRIDRWFFRLEMRQRLRRYLTGLLGAIPRRNSWQLAEAIGDPNPHGIQRLLYDAQWDADSVRDDLRDYVVDHMGDPAGVLVVDETGFLKQGNHSVGVQPQYTGTAGKVANCQIGVFLAYASPCGTVLLDRELYIPREWARDSERRRQAGVPSDVEFATKPELAERMIARAVEGGVPCAWVTGDEVYGRNRRLRRALEEREQPFVLAVPSDEPLWVLWDGMPQQIPARTIAQALSEEAWERLSAGDGAKGPRWYDWAAVPLARLAEPLWRHALLVRRSLADPTDLAYYVVFARRETDLLDWVRVAGCRWTIDAAFEGAKQEVGLDEYEVRSWTGWYRYLTLAMLAYAFLEMIRVRIRSEADATGDSQKGGTGQRPLCRSKSSGDAPPPDDRGAAAVDAPRDPPALEELGMAGEERSRTDPELVALAPPTPSQRPTLSLPKTTTPSIAYPRL
jgi:SRSO17 transposase